MPPLHKNPAYTHTHRQIVFNQLLAPRGGTCPARMAALLNWRPVMLVVPSSFCCYHSQPFNTKFGFVPFQLPLQPFSVPISILPSSLFLICEFWLENLANLDSNNGLYRVLFYCLLIHMLYWTLFSGMSLNNPTFSGKDDIV